MNVQDFKNELTDVFGEEEALRIYESMVRQCNLNCHVDRCISKSWAASDAVISFTTWNSTSEGADYWGQIYDALGGE